MSLGNIWRRIKIQVFALKWLEKEENQRKGEFVIVVQGNNNSPELDEQEAVRILKVLLKATSVKQAVSLAAEITGLKKNDLYKLALSLKK